MPLSDEIIRNCTWGFACDKRFEDMAPTAFEDVRHCGFCQKSVHYCDSDAQLAYAVRQGWCVAIRGTGVSEEAEEAEQGLRLTTSGIIQTIVEPDLAARPSTFRELARTNRAFSKPPAGYEKADWASASPLHLLGYGVGRSGVSLARRRALLEAFCDASLPSEYPAQYRERWGEPSSQVRLDTMSSHLRWLARQASQRSNAEAMAVAISDWESDAQYVETVLAET